VEVTGQPQAPAALPPRKESRYQLHGDWVGPRTGLYILEKRRISCPFRAVAY